MAKQKGITVEIIDVDAVLVEAHESTMSITVRFVVRENQQVQVAQFSR